MHAIVHQLLFIFFIAAFGTAAHQEQHTESSAPQAREREDENRQVVPRLRERLQAVDGALRRRYRILLGERGEGHAQQIGRAHV